jgi:hypothetical protein
MTRLFISEDYTNHGGWRAYLPHTHRLFWKDKTCDLGACLTADSRAKEAVCYFEERLKSKEKRDDEESQPVQVGPYICINYVGYMFVSGILLTKKASFLPSVSDICQITSLSYGTRFVTAVRK